MKSVEGRTAQAAVKQAWETDIQVPAVEMLKTMVLLERGYGINYISALTRGEAPPVGFKKEHEMFETFGMLPKYSSVELRLSLSCLERMGMISAVNSDYNTFLITQKGRDYLAFEGPLYVESMAVRFTPVDYYLYRKFSEYRMKAAKREKKELYQIYSNFTIDRFVKDRPEDMGDIKATPGMTHEKAEAYGKDLLAILKKAEEAFEDIRIKEIKRRSEHYTHIKVLEMFQSGYDVEEIARTLGCAEITVKLYLSDFHVLGIIDLRADIEAWVKSKDLYRASEYFQRVSKPDIREAAKSLGMDVLTLRLVQAYNTEPSLVGDSVPN